MQDRKWWDIFKMTQKSQRTSFGHHACLDFNLTTLTLVFLSVLAQTFSLHLFRLFFSQYVHYVFSPSFQRNVNNDIYGKHPNIESYIWSLKLTWSFFLTFFVLTLLSSICFSAHYWTNGRFLKRSVLRFNFLRSKRELHFLLSPAFI